MNYYPRLNLYKAANVTFDPSKVEAHSYRWWKFVAVIDGLVVFNSYRYSPTTARHQSKVANVMRNLGIRVDLDIECPRGLDNLESAIGLYQRRIEKLRADMAKKGTRKAKNVERAADIKANENRIVVVQALIDGLNGKKVA
jgi:uncharacterized small protein (DUF1192 family)